MAGNMKFNLTCPRCNGTGRLKNACPTCHGDGRIAHTETVEVRIPPGAQQRLAAARGRQRQRRNHGRASGRSLHHHQRGAASVVPREGDNIQIKVPVTIDEAGWAPRSKCRPSTARRC
jgi:molecular chaperone DnaJ